MLRLFGPEVVIAGVSLVLLLIGQMMDAVAYGSGYFLSVSDHQYTMLANQWVFGVLNLGLNILAIPAFGMVGAALATATSISLQNAARVVEAWYLEGYVPYEASTLWQTVPVWGGAAVMAAVQGLLNGVGALAIGGTLGFIASAIGLALFATAEDKAIFGQIFRGLSGE
jgi:O-antigen/teichoic acid export membrane protein